MFLRLETDLIDEESPYKGSRTFGMSLAHGRGVASVGTLPPRERHERMPDGRMTVLTRGGRRYRILRVVKERPVLVCEVTWLDDEPDVMGEDDDFTLSELADEVLQLYRTTLALSNKANQGAGGLESAPTEPDEVPAPTLSPEELSFWLMRVFAQYPSKQQALLEFTSARERLKCVQEVLRETMSYLSATSALKSALADIGNGSSSDDTPPQ